MLSFHLLYLPGPFSQSSARSPQEIPGRAVILVLVTRRPHTVTILLREIWQHYKREFIFRQGVFMTGGGVLLYLALNYTTAINVSLLTLPNPH